MKEIMNFLKRVDEMLDEERRVKYDTQDSVIVFGGDINQSAQIIHGQPIVLSGAIANEMLKDEATESIVLKAVEMYKGAKNKKRNGKFNVGDEVSVIYCKAIINGVDTSLARKGGEVRYILRIPNRGYSIAVESEILCLK